MTGAEQSTLNRAFEKLGSIETKVDTITDTVGAIDARLRTVESQAVATAAVDTERQKAHAIVEYARQERSVSRRWIVGVIITTTISVFFGGASIMLAILKG